MMSKHKCITLWWASSHRPVNQMGTVEMAMQGWGATDAHDEWQMMRHSKKKCANNDMSQMIRLLKISQMMCTCFTCGLCTQTWGLLLNTEQAARRYPWPAPAVVLMQSLAVALMIYGYEYSYWILIYWYLSVHNTFTTSNDCWRLCVFVTCEVWL